MSNYELNKLNKLIEEVSEDLQACKDDLIKGGEPENISDLISDNKFYLEHVINRLEILQGQHAFLNTSDKVRLNHLLRICAHIIKSVEV